MEKLDRIIKQFGLILTASISVVALVAAFCGYPWQLFTFVVSSVAALLTWHDIKKEQQETDKI